MTRILVAGIGNIFFGDDAFGCEVASALSRRTLPENVRVEDFGIRSYDLAYALTDGCDVAILVDAMPHGGNPGALLVIEPDVSTLDGGAGAVDAHNMDPVRLLQMVRSLGGHQPRLYLVGCQPGVLDTEDGSLGLSEPVRAAVPHAISMIETLIQDLLRRSTGAPLDAAPV